MAFLNLDLGEGLWHALNFDFNSVNVVSGTKYLGFFIKPNDYSKKDWAWLIVQVENSLKQWCNLWISRGGRMILVKTIIEAIPVYWFTLSTVPACILRRTRIL